MPFKVFLRDLKTGWLGIPWASEFIMCTGCGQEWPFLGRMSVELFNHAVECDKKRDKMPRRGE